MGTDSQKQKELISVAIVEGAELGERSVSTDISTAAISLPEFKKEKIHVSDIEMQNMCEPFDLERFL